MKLTKKIWKEAAGYWRLANCTKLKNEHISMYFNIFQFDGWLFVLIVCGAFQKIV